MKKIVMPEGKEGTVLEDLNIVIDANTFVSPDQIDLLDENDLINICTVLRRMQGKWHNKKEKLELTEKVEKLKSDLRSNEKSVKFSRILKLATSPCVYITDVTDNELTLEIMTDLEASLFTNNASGLNPLKGNNTHFIYYSFTPRQAEVLKAYAMPVLRDTTDWEWIEYIEKELLEADIDD